MAQIQKKWKDVVELNNTIAFLIQNGAGEQQYLKQAKESNETKLTADEAKKNSKREIEIEKEQSLLKKVLDHFMPFVKEYNRLHENLQIDNAMTENNKDDGALLRDEKGKYKFSKAGQKKFNSEVNDLLEVKTYVDVLELPKADEIVEFKFLEGFVTFKRGVGK